MISSNECIGIFMHQEKLALALGIGDICFSFHCVGIAGDVFTSLLVN